MNHLWSISEGALEINCLTSSKKYYGHGDFNKKSGLWTKGVWLQIHCASHCTRLGNIFERRDLRECEGLGLIGDVKILNCPLAKLVEKWEENHHMCDAMCECMHWKGHLKGHAKCSIIWGRSSKLDYSFLIEYYAAFKDDVCKDLFSKLQISNFMIFNEKSDSEILYIN